MGKTSLQNNNKYAGKGTNLRAASLAATFIMGAGLVMSGCGFTRVASAAPTDTPEVTQQVKLTPTAPATPVPTPSPTATPKTVPILTDEQVKEQIELLGIIDPDAIVENNRVACIYFVTKDSNGNQVGKFEFVTKYKNKGTGRSFMCRLWDDQPIFEYDSGYESIEEIPQKNPVPRFESLKDSKLMYVTVVQYIDYICEEQGVPFKKPVMPFTQRFKEAQDSGEIVGSFTYREYAEFYIRALAKENRVDASDFVGPIDYVAPTASPESKETPIPTVAPTLFRDGNASVKYLIGEIDLDTEIENKTKRM